MKIKQLNIISLKEVNIKLDFEPTLILCFSSFKETLVRPYLTLLKKAFPNTDIIGCSSGGNIEGVDIHTASLTLTCIQFESSSIEIKHSSLEKTDTSPISFKDVQNAQPLKHILSFADLQSNDFSFINNFQNQLPPNVKISGGIAATNQLVMNDETYIIYQDKTYKNTAVYIGLYSSDLTVNSGSNAGWDSFGTERIVTKSEGNKLYEVNGKSAYKLYTNYLESLGEHLPTAVVKYPISVRISEYERPIIRSVVGLDPEEQCLIFAGDIPLYSSVKLMKGNLDRIIQGAKKSAEESTTLPLKTPKLALLVSCMGRQAILQQNVQEELEIVHETLGSTCVLTGFYSYGEIAPISNTCKGVLHNQTMTITTISE